MKDALLRVQDLSKSFGGLLAVDTVSFEVGHGEICGVIGPNGAGKSTLFNMIAGEHRPSAGHVYLEGDEISGLPNYEVARRGIGRSFQHVLLFESMSVADNVLVGAENHSRLWLWSSITHFGGYESRHDAAFERAKNALALVGISHLADKPIANLSFGQHRLIGTARALARRPRLVLLDEPAASLSQKELNVLREAVLRVRSTQTSVLIVEHNVEFVLSLCDRVIVMNFGKKIADGKPDAVRRSEAVIEAYLGRNY